MPHEVVPAILYVDDEPVNLRVFEANFRQLFRVVCSPSGADALTQLEKLHGEVAVVISDQRMPGMTGVELLERVRELAPDANRMLITAYSDMQAVIDAVNRGQVSRYFVKPWTKEELQNALQDAVRIFTLQQRMRAVELRMLQSERLATIGQISASVAHELLNPLSYISQNVEMLRGEFGTISTFVKPALESRPDEDVTDSLKEVPAILDDIEQGTKHLRSVGDKLKAQARGEGIAQSCELQGVALFAEKITRSDARRHARVIVKGEPVTVRLSEVDLTQILLNLVMNAVHALAEAGKSGVVELRWTKASDRVQLDVEDNGVGIPEENLARVFEPLFTTKPAGIGTGLGLSTVRSLLREAGGDITVRSKPGEGTTFTLSLPLA